MLCKFRSRVTLLFGSALALGLSSSSAIAQGTAWLSEPGTGTVSISYFNQNATEFYRQTTKVKGPLEATGANLAQNTMWFAASYAVNDAIAVDLRSGWAQSFVAGGVGPSGGRESYSGLFDTTLGLTWRIVDELVSNAPSVAVRVGGISSGGYETGYINSLGDGGNGFETSLIVGKFVGAAGVSAEIGYRNRTSTQVNPFAIGGSRGGESVDIPADVFVNLGLYVPVGDRLTVGADYRMVNALSGIDIGGEGFSPSRFPALQEDAHMVGGRVNVSVTDTIGVNAFIGKVVAGRNTAASRIIGVGVSFGFGGGNLGF